MLVLRPLFVLGDHRGHAFPAEMLSDVMCRASEVATHFVP